MQLEPLAGEVLDEAIAPRVLDESVDLVTESVTLEGSGFGGVEELVVRHRTPEQIGQARGEFRVREFFAGGRVAFDEVDEMAGGEHALKGGAVGFGGLFARGAFRSVGLQVLRQLFVADRTSPGAFGELAEMAGDDLGGGVIAREDAFAAGGLFVRHERTFPLDPVHEHRGEDAVALVIEHLRRVRVQELTFAAVGEEIGPAAEHVAEGRAAAAVDAFGGHYAEVQRRGHVEVDVELVDLRTVFRGVDVELDETGDGLFAGGLADTQVRGLAAGRADAAGLEAQAIEPAVFWPDLAEPLGRKRGLDAAWEEQLAERSLDAEAIKGLLGRLHVAVMHLGRGLADLAGFAGLRGEGALEYRIGGTVVAIHVRRRKRELGADAFEAVPEGIFVQSAGSRRIVAGAEQVVDGVLIFFAAQAIMGDRRTRRHAGGFAFLESGVEVRDEGGDLGLRGLGLLVLLRGHLAGVHLLHRFRPVMRVGAEFEVTRELIETDVALFLLGSVAAGAVLLDERVVGFGGLDNTRQGEAEGE